ncbi:response regulator [Algoriphagus confluentis]|uniref:Response regulator n=1 Tax=Algoriphagus confluentis TaxID=1697556 RepID=A0ABQ6PP09_9BACT|nr:response regulator [Algoriphagus confluentis]
MTNQPIDIFLVEDNEGDILLIQESMDEANLSNRIRVVRDGEEAFQTLEDLGTSSLKNLPDILLLDINLPKKNGHEVLASIKTNPALKKTPIIVLTNSSSENDIFKAYDHHANCYIVKPLEIQDFHHVVKKIKEFWNSVAKLPKPSIL